MLSWSENTGFEECHRLYGYSCIELLREVHSEIDLDTTILYFGNGGDRAHGNYPEKEFCDKNNIETLFGIGGNNKSNSSSWILKKWKE